MSKHQFFGKVSPSNFPITLQHQSHVAATKRPTRCFYMFSTSSFRCACRICARWFKQTLGELVFKSHRFMYKLNSDIDATSVTNWEYITHHVRTTPLSLTWRTLEHTTVDERWSAQVKHPRSNLSTWSLMAHQLEYYLTAQVTPTWTRIWRQLRVKAYFRIRVSSYGLYIAMRLPLWQLRCRWAGLRTALLPRFFLQVKDRQNCRHELQGRHRSLWLLLTHHIPNRPA